MSSSGQSPKKTALVLQGGGARGAYHVGAIQAIAQIAGQRRSPFKIVCGASVGAINAASVAVASNDFQAGAQHLVWLWRNLRSASVFDTRALPLLRTCLRWLLTPVFTHLGRPTTGGLLDNGPLEKLLQREFDRNHLHHAIRSGALHALAITASSYHKGEAVTFFEGVKDIKDWGRARRNGVRTSLGVEHILASAALPFVFAPVLLKDGYFGDGSMRLTSPLSPAIHLGADRILVITTRDDQQAAPAPKTVAPHGPSVGEMVGHALDIMFNDSLESDHERLTRINQTISLVSPDLRHKSPLREIKTDLLRPSKDIRDIARTHAGNVPWAIRLLFHSLGRLDSDGRIESYLMFEPDYINALIELGYSDTMNRAESIRELLSDS